MKITKYRTVAIIYPYLSLEVEVVDNEKKYYVNISVNDNGEPEEIYEDSWWAYDKPLDKLNGNNYDESIVYLNFKEILNQMLEFWNENPVFNNDREWKEWRK